MVISGIDNVIKPLLLKESAQIHPLLGSSRSWAALWLSGCFGFLVGPVILSLVLSALRIYRLDVLGPSPERGISSGFSGWPRLRPLPGRRALW